MFVWAQREKVLCQSKSQALQFSNKNIDESNEWLIGKLEEEVVFEGEDLDWDEVARASGVEEPSKVTRSTHKATSSIPTPTATQARPTPRASRGKTSLYNLVDDENED
ncbi:hypothetical protein RHMOL_Rhmol13G0170200 [Rhododendron molle]|uniref:Uncharacterized protein n=1 Tax=Rhododendron molle TaxID=49168 RepID=A0ACC0L8P9_RHOML|nr:hypothetical protein RHMOL_Rhmol13G0170200 [Rhododendron molle]